MNLKVIIGAALFATLLASVSVVATTTIPGWFIAGDKPASYMLGNEPSPSADGSNIAYLKSKTASVAGFGTMMQMFLAQQYLGKRVRVSASIRSENVKGWAGLWFRVDGQKGDTLAFDNMLYNTLPNVQQLVRSAPADADRMLSSRIQYLKTTIPDVRAGGKATIKHELDRISSYLETMQMRMGKRLQYSLDVSEDLYKLQVPPLGVLTLVENAVKHGIDAMPEGGLLQVVVTRTERKLVVRVLDNGAGFGSEVGSGMGLANLRERIGTQYGERAMLSLNHRKPSGVEAILTIPAE